MHFCNKGTPHPEPSLRLCNTEIPVKAMNLLRVVAHTDWGADSTTLLRLYRSVVRSKLDCGSVVNGSARASYLESLDLVQNAALRICLRAFQTTPVSSLHVEANELLRMSSQKLAFQCIMKLK
jgi:hypothetical protein